MTAPAPASFRDVLRSIPTRPDDRPVLRAASLPTDPLALLRDWLRDEAESGTAVPHGFTLATVGPDGSPQGRTVILKDLDDALWFATSSWTPKGVALASTPAAEAVFWWAESGRQVRLRGAVEPGSRDVSDADFLARHPAARAGVVLARSGTPLGDPETADEALASARALVEEQPDSVPPGWTAYRLVPTHVDLLQLRAASAGERVEYVSTDSGWTVRDLWP